MSESSKSEDVPSRLPPPDAEPVGVEEKEEQHREHEEHRHPHHFRMLHVEGDELVEVKPDEIKTYDDDSDVPRREEFEEPHHGDR